MADSLLPVPEPDPPVEGQLGHFAHSNWVVQALKNLDQGTARIGGGSLGEIITPGLRVNSTRYLWGQTDAGQPRWRITLGDSTPESGNDSGSRFLLQSFSDAGALLQTLLSGDRAGRLTVGGPPTVDNGIATKAYVDQVGFPLGGIVAYGGNTAPAGWHLCDGTAHNSAALQALLGSTTTPDLRSRFIIGAGQGTGLTNYPTKSIGGSEQVTLDAAQTPLKSHLHSIGHDHPRATTGGGGSHAHTMNHGHTGDSGWEGNHNHGGYGPANWYGSAQEQNPPGSDYSPLGVGPGHPPEPYPPNIGNHRHTVSVSTFYGNTAAESGHTHGFDVPNFNGNSSSTVDGSATGHENRPPYYALVYIIKKV